MESSVFPLLTDPWSAWNENRQRRQEHGCQAHRQHYAQIIKFYTFHGMNGSNIHKATISRVCFHQVQDAVCGIASSTLLKVEGNIRVMIQLSGDCKWNVRSRYWKPWIVESLHSHTSKPMQSNPSFRKKLHGQAHFNGLSTAVSCISIVPKLQTKHIIFNFY